MRRQGNNSLVQDWIPFKGFLETNAIKERGNLWPHFGVKI